MIRVGCSGWSYDDYVGRFYPIELVKRKGDWFAYYAQFFNTVEINSTVYRPARREASPVLDQEGQEAEGLRILREGVPARNS